MRYKGLSLIELLVVLAIITIFCAGILPIFHKIRQTALTINCQHNLKQMKIAFDYYAYQHKGLLPHGDRDSDTGPNNCWFDKLDCYLEDNLHPIKQCPAWAGYSTTSQTSDEHSIKMNGGLCPKERLPETPKDKKHHHWYWPRIWDIRKKNRTVLLLDGRMDSPYNTHTDTQISEPYLDIANRHLGGANLLLINGAVVLVKAYNLGLATTDIGWHHSGGYIWAPYSKQDNVQK